MVDDLTPPHWHDECPDFKPSDVLTLKQALEAAILGYNVRAVDMAEGTYVRYDFAGFRIHHAGGSSSGWSSRPHDETVAWHVIDDEPKAVIPAFVAPQPQRIQADWGKQPAKTLYASTKGGGKAFRPTIDDDVPPPAADKWGRPPNVGNAPKRDSWGRLIPG